MVSDENYKYLAAQIIIEIIEDYKISKRRKDKYKCEALLRWFDTPYGDSICELAGYDPNYIKKEVQNIESYKTNIINDYKGIKEIY